MMMITTDRRHIDPNPDRIQLQPQPPRPTPPSNSLLLLSTSAEAAVAESKRFESGSRHSSISTSLPSPSNSPPPPPSNNHPNRIIINPSRPPSSTNSSPSSSSTLNHHRPHPHPHHHHHHHHHHHSNRTLSQSPLRNHHHRLHHRFAQAIVAHQNTHPINIPSTTTTTTNNTSQPNPTHNPRRDQSKGTHLFQCEKCLKVYRHPQCLVKHRWEHTSYWADASKLMLSKHQQVQMLEAAAILAAPSGSLPESRSLWPAAVSPSEAGLLGSDRVNLDVIQSLQAAQASTPGTRNGGGHVSHHHPNPSSTTRMVSDHRVLSSQNAGDVEMSDENHGHHNHLNRHRSVEEGLDEDEDEIMFEMSLDGDEGSSYVSDRSGCKQTPSVHPHLRSAEPDRSSVGRSESLSSISGLPPIGYFERRNPESVSSVISNLNQSLTSSSSISSSSSSSASSSSSSSSHKNRMVASSLPAMVAYQPLRMNDDDHQGGGGISGFVYRSSESIFKPIALYQDSQLRFEGRHPPHRFHPKPAGQQQGSSLDDDDDQSTEEENEDDDPWSQPVDRERDGDEVIGMEL